MSEAVDADRLRKRHWAAPGGAHDNLVRLLKVALPMTIGVLIAYLALAPLTQNREISFLLDKSKVEVAKERMRMDSARYRGRDDKGRPFLIEADSAVQATSRDPIVDVLGLNARLGLETGASLLTADRGRYDLEDERVEVIGPVLFTGADGYRLETRDVAVDLNTRIMTSNGRVDGRMPLGRFSADRMRADLPGRNVTLTGRARLRIEQGALK